MPDTPPNTQPPAAGSAPAPAPEGGQQPAQPPATGGAPPAPPAGGQQGTQPAQGGDEPLGPAGLRALQAERDRAAAAERELAALRSTATEVQQERARREQLEQTLATERAERLRLQVAQQHGVPADAMVLLTGSTEEQLTAQAAQIAALRGAQHAPAAPPAFAPNPGQQAGNATPPGPAATVAAGRQLYQQKNTKT